MSLRLAGEKRVALRWEFLTAPAECSLYFVISGTVDDASIQQIVSGQSREHELDAVNTNSVNIQISAANKLGAGPSSSTVSLQEVSGQTSSQVSGQTNGRSGWFFNKKMNIKESFLDRIYVASNRKQYYSLCSHTDFNPNLLRFYHFL